MASIEDEPIRLEAPGPYVRSQLPVLQETPLPQPLEVRCSFITALAQRRSAEVVTPISPDELATWLHYTTSVQAVNAEDSNRQRRYVASFGALHPAHVLLGDPNGSWSAYVPARHVLGSIEIDPATAAALRAKAQECFQTQEATLVALLADLDLASHYYLNPHSLLLRDGGVLFGHAALVAASLGLEFRILGRTGTPLLERLVRELPFRPVATGLAWVGGGRAV
jgi:hypothetical protein